MSQAELSRYNIRLIDYTPPWVHERKKALEIKCRLTREEDKTLITQVRMGKHDFMLFVKRQGDTSYKQIDIDSFGEIPGLNFAIDQNITPTTPKGRPSFSSDDEEKEEFRKRKRKVRSPEDSTILQFRKPKITDNSYDNPLNNSDTEVNTNTSKL